MKNLNHMIFIKTMVQTDINGQMEREWIYNKCIQISNKIQFKSQMIYRIYRTIPWHYMTSAIYVI